MEKLTQEQKLEIMEMVRVYVNRYPSLRKASASLRGVSAATISNVQNGYFSNVSDEMWVNIRSQVAPHDASDWKFSETHTYQEITYILQDAQKYKNMTWIVGDAGCGKSTTAKLYASKHKEAFVVECSDDMRKGDFLRAMAKVLGIRILSNMTTRDILEFIMDEMILMQEPLLIFDEGDKLQDSVFYYFITIYNRLADKCGVVFLSTSYIKKRINNGLRLDKKGYQEIHSRIGRKFFELEHTDSNDVQLICRANGLNTDKAIKEVELDARKCDYDLRRVKKAIYKQQRISQKNQ